MWLIVTLIATAVASAAYFLLKEQRERLKLGLLALMLFGTFLMVLVDRTIAFINGAPFLEATTGGLITNATVLGLAMIVPIFLIWMVAVAMSLSAHYAA